MYKKLYKLNMNYTFDSDFSHVTTRKPTPIDLETKLKVALEELEISRDTCECLLRERNESENEITEIINKNTNLKKELRNLDNELEDIRCQRDKLQLLVLSYEDCQKTYTASLDRIKELEMQLDLANKSLLETCMQKKECDLEKTIGLYNRLIHLNNQTTNDKKCSYLIPSCNESIVITGSNKIKKYIKLKKIIKNSKKILKKQSVTNKIKKQNLTLVKKMECYKNLVYNKNRTVASQSEKIKYLHHSLNDLTDKYIQSQSEMQTHISSINNLLDLSKENLIRLETLHSACNCQIIVDTVNNNDVEKNLDNNKIMQQDKTNLGTYKTVIFSDGMGRGIGSILTEFTCNSVTNHCYPGASLTDIAKKITLEKIDSMTTLIILIGDSSKVKRSDINNLIDVLNYISEMGVFKIIVCGLPYALNYSDKKIYKFNLLMYNSTCYNAKILYLDLNKFGFKLNKNYTIPKRVLIDIARMFAYNIPNSAMHITSQNNIDLSYNLN